LYGKKKIFPILILLALAVFAAMAWMLTETKLPDALARDGRLDLSGWDGETVLFLSGEWDFYWNRFLDAEDLSLNPIPDLKATVPSVWNKFTVDGKRLGGMGYATYRLRVTGVKAGTPLSLRVLPFSTAYELYLDDALIASCGSVSTSSSGFSPQYRIQTVTFTPDSSEFDLILHVSNFVYSRGGAWYTIYFGSPEKINRISQIVFGRDFFVISCLLLISTYCIYLLCLRRDKGFLLFLALCAVFLARTLINGDYLFNLLIPSLKFSTVIRADYITLYFLPWLCLSLYRYVYPEEIPRLPVELLLVYAAVITAITLVVPIHIFTLFIYVAELIAGATGVYGIVKMILLAVKRKPEALYLFAGGSALTLCIIHDVLGENNLFATGYVEYSTVGFLIMALCFQCMFSARYDRRTKENERMLLELNKADERERKLELQFLKSQIRPHFINNALNTIISISRTDADKSRKLLIEFSKYLQNCYSVQNLDDKVPIENELSFVRAYVKLELARFPDFLHVEYDIDNIFLMVPPLTLQPLVENAIVHGIKEKSGEGHVLIYVKDCGDFAKIGVSDDGVGIDPEYAAALLSDKHIGTGVGIYNINRRMKRLYNTVLHLENRPGGGTDAYIVVPKEGESCCEPY
jgi:sensor histidine kinase YesM